MQKTLFKYQKWFLRILCSGIGLPVVLTIQIGLAKLLDIEYANFGYGFVCIVLMFAWLYIYYKFTQHYKLFERNGAYWVENEIVYIQKGKQIFEIKDVKWLRGTTVSVYGFAKASMLIINYERRKIVLVSSSDTPVDLFSNSELCTLFDAVLKCNTELKKDDTIDFWYETKRK